MKKSLGFRRGEAGMVKDWLWAAVAIAVVAIIYIWMQRERASGEMSTEVLKLEIMAVNQRLPIMVDEVTRFYEVSLDGRRLNYNYEIIKPELVPTDEGVFADRMQSILVDKVCEDKKVRKILQSGITAVYNYKRPDKSDIASIEINREDCKP